MLTSEDKNQIKQQAINELEVKVEQAKIQLETLEAALASMNKEKNGG